MPLIITIPGEENFDNTTQTFYTEKDVVLTLEHSLISISKWEAKWKKSWIDSPEKTNEELFDYIRCMSIKGDVNMNDIYRIDEAQYNEILDYIGDPMSATVIKQYNKKMGKEQFITSELIYAWMAGFGIDFSCDKWHLNRLMNLIAVCGELNKPQEKLSRKEAVERQKAINEANKKKFAQKKKGVAYE